MLNASVKLGVLSGPWRVGTCGGLSATSNSDEGHMAKRFFLSTRKDRSAEADSLSAALKVHGWERTFAWTNKDGEDADGHAAIAVAELQGVREADVLVVLLPGGFGTHVEIGAALALGKPVILHAPDRKTLETPYHCVFHYHPGVTLVVSEVPEIDAILACMPT
jgi:hypothetical protein